MSTQATETNQSVATGLSPGQIEKLRLGMEFIVANCSRGIDLPTIARAACMSPFHFHRLFKTHYNKTVKQAVDELRLAAIKKDLIAGKAMSRIAADHGFSHHAHFCTRFKQLVGTPPARWLREQRSKQPKAE